MMVRLLILGCSGRKRGEAGPAFEVYDGPLYRVLRRRWVRVDVWVWVLSAKYGLIPATNVIESYDLRMTRERARELRKQVRRELRELGRLGWFSEVYVEMGRVYREALGNDLEEVFGDLVQWGEGRIGERCRGLVEWLEGE